MTNNNQVNWDEVPEDVEAVVTFNCMQPSYYKHINGMLYVQSYRDNKYLQSDYIGLGEIRIDAGDLFHLRPSPITEPTPVAPESTQVETSEVETTTTPEFDWSSVDDDVEAIFLHGKGRDQWQQWYKTVEENVMVKYLPDGAYRESGYDSIQERVNDAISSGAEFHVRPPAITPPSENVTCKVVFYEGELPEGMINFDDALKPPITPPEDIGLNAAYDIYKKVAAEVDKVNNDIYKEAAINFKPDADMYDIFKGVDSKPSISTILQEAQQSILKHYGVTGKVKFTVSCSE